MIGSNYVTREEQATYCRLVFKKRNLGIATKIDLNKS